MTSLCFLVTTYLQIAVAKVAVMINMAEAPE